MWWMSIFFFYIRNMKKILLCHGAVMALFAILLSWFVGTGFALAQTSEGRVYLKGGKQYFYVGDDRIEVPRKKRDLEVYHNFFSRQCQSDIIAMGNVDSVVVWNSSAPQNTHTIVPLPDVGWSWLYISHPKMNVYVYASLGYDTNSMGGIRAYQDNTPAAMFLIPGKTACDFYVVMPGGSPVCLGDAYKRCDKSFVRKLCNTVGLPKEVEQQIVKSGERSRSTVVQMVLRVLDGE